MNMLEFYQIFNQKMIDLIKAEELEPSDVWAGSQLTPIPRALRAECYTMQDNAQALITGDPFFWAERLDSVQGYDNAFGAADTCALTAITNLCRIAGEAFQEPDVVNYAVSRGYCVNNKGWTTLGGQLRLLSDFRHESHCEFNLTSKSERIAQCIEGGHGVICVLNQGILQNKPHKVAHALTGKITANHAVCMTGTLRDAYSGALKGFYLCDSSYGGAYAGMIYAPLEMMKACYEDIEEGAIVVTNARIR